MTVIMAMIMFTFLRSSNSVLSLSYDRFLASSKTSFLDSAV